MTKSDEATSGMKPQWKSEIRRRLADLRLAPTREAAIVEELAQYLEDCYAELLASGASEAEAYEQALAELSGSEFLTRELRRMERQVPQEPIVLGTIRRRNMIADLWQDLRYGARMLLKQPGFTLIAALTLALGIGANTAIFSLVNAVLLRALPYPEPGRLVRFWETNPGRGWTEFSASAPNFAYWRKQQSVCEQLAAYGFNTFNFTGSGEPERVAALRVTANLFSVLGVAPAHGRDFLPEDEQSGRNHVAILSDGLWQRRFGADPNLIGRQIQLSGESYTVVGVMPPGFQLTQGTELWTPLTLDLASNGHNLSVIGRLKLGVSLAQAQASMDTIARQLEQQYPESNTGWGVRMSIWLVSAARASRLPVPPAGWGSWALLSPSRPG